MRRVVPAIVLLLATSDASAQTTWRDLYDRGDFGKAAAILHPLVLEIGPPVPDVDATAALSRLYLNGLGVPQDKILACSFAILAMSSAMFRHHLSTHPVVAGIERLEALTCAALSTEEREEAAQMTGCPKYGPAPHVFYFDVDYSAEISRRGIRIERGGKQRTEPVLTLGCFQRVALVRHARVYPTRPDDDVPTRDLLEVFTWLPAGSVTSGQQRLMWQLGEVLNESIEWRTVEMLGEYAGLPWTDTALPAHIGSAVFEMQSRGVVNWRLGGTERQGWLEALPELVSADLLPPLPTVGTAHLDVSVSDRFGAPVAGAVVKLSGVVSREGLVDEAGLVAFESLPDGRYDVTASAKGMASTVPRVLDLLGPGVTDVQLTLKPRAPGTRSTIACGGFDSSSIQTLGAGAALVLHVKVTGQRTEERPGAYPGDRADLFTVNEVLVLGSFKRSALEPAPGQALTIQQGGGRLDRGGYVDHHSYNRLDPLNVGDEYVLFIWVESGFTPGILGAEEGTFRVRNGRVEPLGSGGAATAWKGRSSASFFEVLHKKVNRRLASGQR